MAASTPAGRARTRLHIRISSAAGLRAADTAFFGKGSSDPYCLCQIADRPQTKVKTQVIKGNLDPNWNEEFRIDGCAVGDSIEFTVWDQDLLSKDDMLGRARLVYEDFHGGGFDGELTLAETKKNNGSSTLRVSVREENMAGGHPDEARAFVKICRASGLRAADFGGKSDPYVVCQVPGENETAVTTKVLMRTLEPEWNEEDEVRGYRQDDILQFIVKDYDLVGSDDDIGTCFLEPKDLYQTGPQTLTFRGDLALEPQGTLTVEVDVFMPSLALRPVDVGAHVDAGQRYPVPFQLRCLDTGRVHRVVAYTQIGRSGRRLDPDIDLVLNSPGIGDVSRVHALIKAWRDLGGWHVQIYDPTGGGGAFSGPGEGHAGGGTTVDGHPVDAEIGTAVEPGAVLRFGINEMWVLDRASVFHRSVHAAIGQVKASTRAEDDPVMMRELRVPDVACHNALKHCPDWMSLVRVVLEWLGEPDEPPCVDCIEVRDECKCLASRHEVNTLEDQEAYDVKRILRDVRMGTSLRLRLSSEPRLLAPVLESLDEHRQRLEKIYSSRDDIPD